MAARVKVCGITRPEDAEVALRLGADFIGIILYPKSPRAVSLERVPELLEAIPRGKRVMVDVDPAVEVLESRMGLGFDAYQMHFDLEIPIARVARWSKRVGQEALWAAPRIPPGEEAFTQILMEFADTFVVDAYDKSSFGGTGKAGTNWQRFLDWTLLYQHKRWILAGGLSPETIGPAIAFTQAEFVDVNSGVESAPGIKDAKRLEAFFQNLRAAEAASDGRDV